MVHIEMNNILPNKTFRKEKHKTYKMLKSILMVFSVFLYSAFVTASFAYAQEESKNGFAGIQSGIEEGKKVGYEASPEQYRNEDVEVGTPIWPAGIIEIPKAKLLTPEDIEAFEANQGAENHTSESVPFMPTDDPREYEKAKAKANAAAAETLGREHDQTKKPGLEPSAGSDPPTRKGITK